MSAPPAEWPAVAPGEGSPRFDNAPEPLAPLLDAVAEWFARFVNYPHEHALAAHVAWTMHTHLMPCFEDTPRLAFLSPEPGSGKSRALEVTEPLVFNARATMNATAAYLFRSMTGEDGEPAVTLLFDEVDAIFAGRPSERSEELRSLLNSGYRRGATVGRIEARGREQVPCEFPTFCPVALAGLGNLPDTLMTRAVVVNMRRRRPDEPVTPYRRAVYREEGEALRVRLESAAAALRPAVLDALRGWSRSLPDGVVDRNADVWEPLIVLGDLAGREWSDRIRAAAVAMIAEQAERPATLGIRLLGDTREVFADDVFVTTADLLERLLELEAGPWATLGKSGDGIDARYLARMFRQYDITPVQRWEAATGKVRGYEREAFADPWARYLPPPREPEPDAELEA